VVSAPSPVFALYAREQRRSREGDDD
jgi:hypothetical protein